MAITEAAITVGSAVTVSSQATASVTPTTNRLQLLCVLNNRDSSSTPTTPTVTGNSLTWVQVDTVLYDSSSKRITMFRALGTATTGTATIDFAGESQTGIQWSWAEFAGIDTTGTNGSGAIVQSVNNTTASALSLTVTLAAFGNASNATFGYFGRENTSGVISAGSGFTQIHEQSASVAGRQISEWRNDNDTTVDCSWATTNRACGGIAIEIKAPSTAGFFMIL